MTDLPKRVLVMAEIGSSGIFDASGPDPESRTMLTHVQLGLPPDVRRRFEHWLGLFWDISNRPTSFDLGKTNEIGRVVAEALKGFLGAAVVVEYQPISITGARGKVEVVP